VHVAKQVSSDSSASRRLLAERSIGARSSTNEIAYELDDLDQVQLKLSMRCPGYVVLTDLYYLGWQASIEGKPREIYRANFAFRAIKIEPGQHSVRFPYQPLTTSIGFPLSAITTTEINLEPAAAVILAVAHQQYITAGWPHITRLLKNGRGVVMDGLRVSVSSLQFTAYLDPVTGRPNSSIENFTAYIS
jgi:hypothetical protein